MAIRPQSALKALRGSAQTQAFYQEPAKPVFLLFLAYLFYMYLQGGVRWPVLGDIRFELIMGLVLVPLAAIAVRRGSVPEERSIVRWSITLLLAMLLMVPFSQVPAFSWDTFYDRGVKFAAYGLFIAAFVTSPRNLRWFLLAFLAAFFKMGFEGLIGTITGSLIWQNQEIPRLHGATPSYAHPNSFSGTQLGVLPFIYYLFPLQTWLWRIALLVQLALCTNVVLRTGSRTGYLAFLAAVASIMWLSKSRVRALLTVVLLGMAVIPFIPQDYMGRFSSIFEDKSQAGEDTSVGQRKEILVDAMAVFSTYPLGIGVGAFPKVRERIFGRKQDTHNLYLEVATNLGVQGCIVFLGFIVAVWMTLLRLRRRLQRHLEVLEKLALPGEPAVAHGADIRLLLACAHSTWVFLTIRLVLGAFGMDMYEIYWWFMAGLTVALLRLTSAAEERTLALATAAGKPADAGLFKPSPLRTRRQRSEPVRKVTARHP